MTAHDAPVDDALVAPPAKRARLQDSSSVKHQDASPVCVAASTRLGPFAPSLRLGPNEALLRALTQGGVLRFLSLADAAALVQTSRALRTDAQLLATCARLLPDFQRLFPDEASVVFRLPPRSAWVEQLPVETPAELPAQVLATASFLKQRVAKWCFQFEPERPNADDDLLCAVQPVLLPLPLFRDAAATPANGTASPPLTPATAPSASASALSAAKPKWTRSPIKAALNAFCPGGGDAFFDDKSAAESRFATHWDSIYVDRVTGRVSCRLCDAVHAALTHYKQQVETGLRQHELLLRCQEAAWASKPPAERQQLADAFRAKCFPPDAYIRPECAAWPDQQLLRHICEHGKLPAWQIGDTRARGVASADALLRAVSFKYQHQCRSFYQPLKKALHAKCHVVGRLPHATLQHLRHEPIKDDSEVQNQRVLTELVGGVDCTSGIFTGVQVTFRLTQ